jgi:spore coat polysaccharide biosynthesis protein SpsF (cytidylyltransferase family)
MSVQSPDLTRPWSEDECLVELQTIKARIENEILTLKALGQARTTKADAYERAHAREFLRAKFDRTDLTSNELREAWVIDQTDVWDLHLESEKAETIYQDQRTTIRALQSIIDALRSMLRSVRDVQQSGEYGYGNRG